MRVKKNALNFIAKLLPDKWHKMLHEWWWCSERGAYLPGNSAISSGWLHKFKDLIWRRTKGNSPIPRFPPPRHHPFPFLFPDHYKSMITMTMMKCLLSHWWIYSAGRALGQDGWLASRDGITVWWECLFAPREMQFAQRQLKYSGIKNVWAMKELRWTEANLGWKMPRYWLVI